MLFRSHTRALRDGSVRPGHFAFDFVEVPTIVNAFRRMVRGLEFDVSEMAITTYICAREHGKAFTALPIFPMRAFHHGAIVHNVRAGLSGPKDLEGRQVGVNRGYTVTTGLWARGILQHEFGVDLRKVTWVLSGDEHVAEWRPPSNVVPLAPGRTLEELLVAGEIPAAVGVQVDHPDVQPLIPDAKAAGFRAFRDRGLYPINHTVVVLVGSVHRGVLAALAYARSLRPENLIALHVASSEEEQERIQETWREFGLEDDLEIVFSPYRELTRPVLRYIDQLERGHESETVTVVIPEFVVHRWWEHLLHNQSALVLKARLLFRKGTVVTSIPYHHH